MALGGGSIVTEPRSVIETAEVVAAVPGTDFQVWREQGLRRYDAPQVPDEAATYLLDGIIGCSMGYVPVAAWHEITGSWPSIDVMYTVNASVTDDDRIEIDLRSRQGFERGYAYIDVIVQCSRT